MIATAFRPRVLVNALLLVASGLVALSLAELILKLSRFPTQIGDQITHPPNFRETRTHLEYTYDFVTNSLGLRNVEISKDKPRGMSRILLAGDSFIEGIGVNGDSTISSFLERELSGHRPLQVINGGLQGTGVFEQGRLVREIGYQLDLDGLLFFVFDNDVFDTRLAQQAEAPSEPQARSGIKAVAHYFWPRTYTVSSKAWSELRRKLGPDLIGVIELEARTRGISERRIEQWRARVLPVYGTALKDRTIATAIFSLSLVSPHFWSGSIDLDLPDMQEKFATMTNLLSANIADARSRGIKVGVVYIPSKFQYDPEAHSPSEPWVLAGAETRLRWLSVKTPIRERLEAWASQIGVEYLDTTPYYREATSKGERLTWRLDEHFNARGNEYTAVIIADWLRRTDGFGSLLQ